MPSCSSATSFLTRAVLCSALAAAACTGSINGDPPRGGGSDTRGGGASTGSSGGGGGGSGGNEHLPPPPASLCQNVDPGPSPMRLLTRVEYMNTIRDLLGAPASVAMDLPDDGRPARGYANDTAARAASDLLVDKFAKAAEKLATQALGQMSSLLGGCDPTKDGEMACLNRFFDNFGKRAWRRPLQAEEKANLTRAFTEGKGQKGFSDGLEAVLEVMLMAPQFLYRYEQGADVAGKKYAQLTPWEIASRLSYLLWGSMPDATLMTAAEKNELSTREQILAQARRMVDDQRYMPMVKNFVEQFLELDQLPTLDKDAMTLPKWNPDLRPQMLSEADKFIESIFAKSGDGKLGTLLTAPYSFVNPALASYYGVTGGSADFGKTSFPADRSSGVLTMGGWLAVHGTTDDGLTSLVFRGKWVKEQLLCQPIPDPPPNAQDENPPFTETTTSREWAMLRMGKMVCGACHKIMDPIGFGFENFDPIGKWRDTDRGKKVDASGELIGSDVDGPFAGVPALGKMLAKSQAVSDCVATQWFRFASGREETDRDSCSLKILRDKFRESGGDLRELLVQFTQTDAFLFRSKGDAP
jgi:hypothetical protein